MNGRAGISVRPRRRFNEDRIDALSACAVAAGHTKNAGLMHVWTSMKSEACYYRSPDRQGTLRIATHSKTKSGDKMLDGPTIVSVTFPETNLRGFTVEFVENHIANGIGLYLIRAPRKPERAP